MNNPYIYILNLRGYILNSKKYIKTLRFVSDIMNNTAVSICAFSEYVYGKREYYHKYLLNLLEDDWMVYAPKGYDSEMHWRSAINVVFVRKTAGFDVQTLDLAPMLTKLPDYAYLYNYLEFSKYDETDSFRLLNVHNVNRCINPNMSPDYSLKRLRLASSFWSAIQSAVIGCNKNLIVLGDNNAEVGDPDFDLLILESNLHDTFDDNRSIWKCTYATPDGKERRYDHILTNYLRGYSIVEPDSYIWDISDHCGVAFYKETA